jgi:hypothetical protein
MIHQETHDAVEAIDGALQRIDASVEAALNAFNYLAASTISSFPEEDQEESLEMFIDTLRTNAAVLCREENGATLQ